MDVFSMCTWIKISLLLYDTIHWIRAYHTPIWSHFNLTYISKVLLLSKGIFPGSWGWDMKRSFCRDTRQFSPQHIPKLSFHAFLFWPIEWAKIQGSHTNFAHMPSPAFQKSMLFLYHCLLLKIIFIYFILIICMFKYHTYNPRYPRKPEEGVRSFGTRITDSFEPPRG